MLNIRTGILSIAVVGVFALTVSFVTARTETNSYSSSNQANLSEMQERSENLSKTYNVPAYRSQFGECFDVSIQERGDCQDHGQPSVQNYRPRLDVCFDVSIREIASCRVADQKYSP